MDPRLALRSLWRDRGFALTVVLVLGLGIGVNHVFFTLVYGFKLRGLPIDRADRVLHISTLDDRARDRGVSLPELTDLQQDQRSFHGLAAFGSAPVIVGDEGRSPDRFEAAYVTANAFAQLGITPVAGRPFTEADEAPGAPAVVILGDGPWRTRYDGDPAVVGRAILVNGSPAAVIGVVAERSGFPSTAAVFLPLRQMPGLALDRRDARTLRVFGRLRDGASAAGARADIEARMAAIAGQHPETNANVRARVVTINERLLGTLDGWLPFIVAGLIIVFVACANAANLMLARTAHRAPEIAVRTALGASRGRIAGQLLMECVLLSMLGGAAGLGLSVAGTRAVRAMVPDPVLPYWTDFSPDARVFGALALVSFGAVLIFGLLPAIYASRTDVSLVLNRGGQRSGSRAIFRRSTAVFLAAQVALAIVLLAQVGVATLRSATNDTPGQAPIEPEAVMTASVSLPPGAYATPERRSAFFRSLEERLRAQPAIVSDASAVSALPAAGAPERRLDVRDRPAADGRPTMVMTVEIGPAYFRTLRLPLARGREFTEEDDHQSSGVAIVNARMAELFFPGESAIGRQIALTPPTVPAGAPAWLTIVGIAPVIRQRPSAEPLPIAYVPIRSTAPASAAMMVRARGEISAVAGLMRREAQRVDAGVPLYRMQSLSAAIEDAGWNGRVASRIAVSLTILTFVLATIGLYAVIAWGVARRTREIGIRMALGARRREIVLWVVGTARAPLAAGVMLGLLGSLAWERAFSVDRADALVPDRLAVAIIAAGIAVMTLAACVVPARRASRLDPARALRLE